MERIVKLRNNLIASVATLMLAKRVDERCSVFYIGIGIFAFFQEKISLKFVHAHFLVLVV